MALQITFAYSGIIINGDDGSNIAGSVEDFDPEDNLMWLAIDPAERPASISYSLNGNDRIFMAGLFNNNVDAGEGDDTVNGGGGNDDLFGNSGDDSLDGGSGNDTMDGWTGSDFLFGNTGTDTLFGNVGDDILNGGGGDDFIFGGTGSDDIFGDVGNDDIRGGQDNDSINAFDGDDSIRGGSGEDDLNGGIGNDVVRGQVGNDYVFGDAGDDDLRGGDGTDEVEGGAGADLLRGGEDRDAFYFASVADSTSAVRDTIGDFQTGLDNIDVIDVYDKPTTVENDALKFLGVAATFTVVGQIRLEQSGKDTLVHINTNSNFTTSEMVIVLQNVNANTVTADDFYL
jgi:Ca2+-binding RTX toxin-like protein